MLRVLRVGYLLTLQKYINYFKLPTFTQSFSTCTVGKVIVEGLPAAHHARGHHGLRSHYSLKKVIRGQAVRGIPSSVEFVLFRSPFCRICNSAASSISIWNAKNDKDFCFGLQIMIFMPGDCETVEFTKNSKFAWTEIQSPKHPQGGTVTIKKTRWGSRLSTPRFFYCNFTSYSATIFLPLTM